MIAGNQSVSTSFQTRKKYLQNSPSKTPAKSRVKSRSI
jgi:hypothetical protein